MSYKIEGGIWASVFAVPTTVVDEHIRMCSPFALKVLLFMLRHPTVLMDTLWLSDQLHSSPRDIQDALSYWVGAGIISNDAAGVPMTHPATSAAQAASAAQASAPTVSQAPQSTAPAADLPAMPVMPGPHVVEKNIDGQRIVTTSARPRISRTDVTEISRSDPSLAQLLQEAQSVLGGPLSSVDSEILAALYTYYGMPVDVILMLLQYCVSIGKSNMHSIEKMAANWAEKNINSHERAEQELMRLTQAGENEAKIIRAFHLQGRGLSAKEKEFTERWFALGLDERVIAYACESTLDRTGKASFPYADKMIVSWKAKGIQEVKDAILEQQQNAGKFTPAAPQNKSAQTAGSSIDMEALDAYINGQFSD